MHRVGGWVSLALLSILALGGVQAVGAEVLTLATTTSTENSGLLAAIHPEFTAQTGIEVKVVAKGTGASLQLARDGNADVVLTHARPLEDAFVAEEHGVWRRDVMYNDFIVLGPPGDPAGIKGAATAADALRTIAAGRHPFISRGDDSGTHIKEQELWRATKLPLEEVSLEAVVDGKARKFTSVRPSGDWYWSIGQGMGKTLTVASEKQAYTLADRGTFYAFALASPPKTDLVIVGEGDPALFNPYGVIAVNPHKHPHVHHEAARKYIEWITSPATQRRIASFSVGGKTLFFPMAVPDNKRQ